LPPEGPSPSMPSTPSSTLYSTRGARSVDGQQHAQESAGAVVAVIERWAHAGTSRRGSHRAGVAIRVWVLFCQVHDCVGGEAGLLGRPTPFTSRVSPARPESPAGARRNARPRRSCRTCLPAAAARIRRGCLQHHLSASSCNRPRLSTTTG
jgi:hypothetical protein